jgi:hypothetical protein
VLEPMGVASRSAGGIGRARLGWTSFEPFTTGLALGDGGMERPRRGGRLPLWARPPGTGGRRRGTAEDMLACGLEVGPLAVGSIYCGFSQEPSSLSRRCSGRFVVRCMIRRASSGGEMVQRVTRRPNVTSSSWGAGAVRGVCSERLHVDDAWSQRCGSLPSAEGR